MNEKSSESNDNYYINDKVINAESLSLKDRRGLLLNLFYIFDIHDYQITIEDVKYYYYLDFNIHIESDDSILLTLQNIINQKDTIDVEISKYLYNWSIDRLSTLVKLILRYAFFEFLYTTQDSKLIINESVELAKAYAEIDSYKFVNGILDNYYKKNNKV